VPAESMEGCCGAAVRSAGARLRLLRVLLGSASAALRSAASSRARPSRAASSARAAALTLRTATARLHGATGPEVIAYRVFQVTRAWSCPRDSQTPGPGHVCCSLGSQSGLRWSACQNSVVCVL